MLLSRDTETFNIPDRLPVVPLRDVVVFPYAIMPLLIGRTGSLSAVEAAAATPERWIVLVTQRSAEVAEPQAGDLYRIGVVVRLQQVSRTPSGGARTVRLELASGWERRMPDDELLAAIAAARGD